MMSADTEMVDQKRPYGIQRCHRYFCFICGSLLPQILSPSDTIKCAKCGTATSMQWFQGMRMRFTDGSFIASDEVPLEYMSFFPRLVENAKKILREESKGFDHSEEHHSTDGPSIRKDCAYCGNDRMSYVTLQTRSADEGQTVIYTCTKCSKKEVENT